MCLFLLHCQSSFPAERSIAIQNKRVIAKILLTIEKKFTIISKEEMNDGGRTMANQLGLNLLLQPVLLREERFGFLFVKTVD